MPLEKKSSNVDKTNIIMNNQLSNDKIIEILSNAVDTALEDCFPISQDTSALKISMLKQWVLNRIIKNDLRKANWHLSSLLEQEDISEAPFRARIEAMEGAVDIGQRAIIEHTMNTGQYELLRSDARQALRSIYTLQKKQQRNPKPEEIEAFIKEDLHIVDFSNRAHMEWMICFSPGTNVDSLIQQLIDKEIIYGEWNTYNKVIKKSGTASSRREENELLVRLTRYYGGYRFEIDRTQVYDLNLPDSATVESQFEPLTGNTRYFLPAEGYIHITIQADKHKDSTKDIDGLLAQIAKSHLAHLVPL